MPWKPRPNWRPARAVAAKPAGRISSVDLQWSALHSSPLLSPAVRESAMIWRPRVIWHCIIHSWVIQLKVPWTTPVSVCRVVLLWLPSRVCALEWQGICHMIHWLTMCIMFIMLASYKFLQMVCQCICYNYIYIYITVSFPSTSIVETCCNKLLLYFLPTPKYPRLPKPIQGIVVTIKPIRDLGEFQHFGDQDELALFPSAVSCQTFTNIAIEPESGAYFMQNTFISSSTLQTLFPDVCQKKMRTHVLYDINQETASFVSLWTTSCMVEQASKIT